MDAGTDRSCRRACRRARWPRYSSRSVVPLRLHCVEMRTIGVRELKTTLSQRLKEVRAGEVYWVTDRGTVIAELRAPGPSAPETADEFERRIAERVRSGRAVCGGRNRAELYARSPLRCAEGTAERVLDAERSED